MTQEFKKEWCEKLRSGEYIQGKGRLYNPESNTYCCIGVGAIVAEVPNEAIGGLGTIPKEFSPEYSKYKIPIEIIGNCANPIVRFLVAMNDGLDEFEGNKQTFSQIADYIEQNL